MVASFTEDKVRDELWSCESFKNPGLDGLSFSFWKEFWDLLKTDLMRLIFEFHQYGKIVKGLNPSFIVLIPKKEEARDMSDYRPIPLIGEVYKILSKVLAKRLNIVLDSIISKNQSAFVGNKYILDLVLNEAIDEAKKRKIEKIFFKIDFAKAYDSVDWGFLNLMMECFNFNPLW